MKSAETLLACCVVGLACFIGGQTYGVRGGTTASEAAGIFGTSSTRATRPSGISGTAAREGPTSAARGARLPVEPEVGATGATVPDRAALPPAEMRRRVALGMAGTYLDELLLSRDSALTRWPDRRSQPLRVWVDEAERLAGWTPAFVEAVHDAFGTWVQAGVPLRFTFVPDSVGADIHVSFTDHFPNGISGKTVWSRDAEWWLVSGNIRLAVDHPAGGRVSAPQMRAIALHEVGHLLGLDHANAPDHIMSSRVRVRDLSDVDRATVRLLYSLPAGSLKP